METYAMFVLLQWPNRTREWRYSGIVSGDKERIDRDVSRFIRSVEADIVATRDERTKTLGYQIHKLEWAGE